MTEITIYVSKQTLGKSIADDIATAITVGGPIVLNELTLQSTTLNFLFGFVSLLIILGRVIQMANQTRVRGTTTEEVIAKVQKRLDQR